MKQKKISISNPDFKQGFSLIELMVVLAMFGIILGLIMVNFSSLRNARNLKIAQNELVSNLRKVQSYTLSSRALNATQPVQFYLLKFDTATPDRYTVQAMYNLSSSPQLNQNVETIMLPQGVRFSTSTPFIIDRPNLQYPNDPTDSGDVTLSNGNITTCALVAFKLPFGNVIVNSGTDVINSANNGCRFNNFSNDDYTKLKDFVVNTSTNTASNNSIITITLISQDGKLKQTVTLNGITGAVTFSS